MWPYKVDYYSSFQKNILKVKRDASWTWDSGGIVEFSQKENWNNEILADFFFGMGYYIGLDCFKTVTPRPGFFLFHTFCLEKHPFKKPFRKP